MTTELRHGYCALCISRCGCVGTVVNGILTRVDPDPAHPTGQALCVKAKAAAEAVYAPDRILHPLRRSRPKGEADPGWERISWDEALDLVAGKMRTAMAQASQSLAFGVATPSGTAMADSFAWIHRLAHACHSPNLVFATENCNWHKDFAPAYTFGAGIGMPDYQHTGCILMWGFNPATTWLAQATAVRQAQKRGARLIVVDPRRAGLAAAADLWLRPHPGSDGALALGLARLLIESGRIDHEFLTRWSDAPGGNVWFSKPPVADVMGFGWVSPEERALTLGRDERPQGPPQKGWITSRDLFRAVVAGEPYPISCLVSFGSNFLLSKPNTRLSESALRQLDFFALTELVETPTARYADLVLPVCSAWEREGLQAGFQVSAVAEAQVQLRPAFVPPQGESRSDTWIVFELAKRLGLAEQFFGGNPETALAEMLAPAGLTPEALRAAPGGISMALETRYRKYEQNGFATPSGRLELHSERLRGVGLDPLPDYVTAGVRHDPRFPLTLTTAKWPQYCHSQQRNQPSLRRRMPEPLVELHPETAAARGLGEGDWLEVTTSMGRMRARARLDRHLAPEVVCAQYGWWQYPDGAGDANRLIDGECFDPVAGSNSLRNFPCQIARVLPA